ncbi:MAG TPA: hypothetical protein VMT52_07760 [Planctomycetota bacterium]|nr:hypothetical protein [Planctomycetota bacterium]
MNDDENEPLIPGLDLPPGSLKTGRPPSGLRERVLEQTCSTLRSRVMRRRFLRAGWIGAVYAAGFLTAALVTGPWEPAPPAPVPSGGKGTPPTPTRMVDPSEVLRAVAAAPQSERSRLLRFAGDVFLEEQGDLASALDCYRQVLELDEKAPPLPDDTWLLAALKQSTNYSQER